MLSQNDFPPTRDAQPIAERDAETIRSNPRSTIVPSRARHPTPAGVFDSELDLLDTIGEGGMGLVRRGVQRALGREVAVKGLKPDRRDQHAAAKLLREARVTGGLEHPNVIPVYDIAQDDDGAPLIVLKKVEGVDWATLMHDPRAVRERFGTDDLFEWNVRVLVQVCNAVGFAHSRHVLHRDIKPENVMIGRFGEVYLVDWGIAVALREEGARGGLPLASTTREMAGTPVYMAPEMLGGHHRRLSERTDVYLLGAVLHEIVTGRPPHSCGGETDIVASILASAPVLPDDVPAELKRIIVRALDPDPDARFERPEQLRLALEAFLRRRAAVDLAREAEQSLARLLGLLDTGRPEDREPIYRLYGACRFGLRHALDAWPENEEARRSLHRASVAMIDFELAHGEPAAAGVLLRDLDPVPPELEARVEEAQAQQEKQYAALKLLQADLDPGRGRRQRHAVTLLLAALWTVWPMGVELGLRFTDLSFTSREMALYSPLVLLGVLGVTWWNWSMISMTAINRRLCFAIVLTASVHAIWALAALGAGASVWKGLHDRLLTAAAIVAMLAASVHWGLLVAAAGYLVAYAVTAWLGLDAVLYASSASNMVLFVNLVVLFSRSPGTRKPA